MKNIRKGWPWRHLLWFVAFGIIVALFSLSPNARANFLGLLGEEPFRVLSALVLIIGFFAAIFAFGIWRMTKEAELPRCPTCGQILREGQKHLAKPE